MQFVFRQEGETSNPTLARPYGPQSTRGLVVLHDMDGDRKKFIVELCQGGRYGCDGIDEYHYNGHPVPEFEAGHEGDEAFRNWKFYPGTRSLGFDDPVQGRSWCFPTFDHTFSQRAHLDVKLPADISPGADQVPDGSEIFMRGLKVMSYNLVDDTLEEAGPAFLYDNASVTMDLLREVGKLSLSRFQRFAQSWVDWKTRCNELITWDRGPDAGGEVEIKRHTASIVYSSSIDYGAAVETCLFRSPGAAIQDVNGALRVLPNPDRDPIHTFTPQNILRKGVILTPPDPDTLYNFFLGTYRDIDDKDGDGNRRYKEKEAPPVHLAKFQDDNDGILNQLGPVGLGLMNQSEAERIMWYLARTKTALNAERDMADDPIHPLQFEIKGQMDSFRVAKSDYAEIDGHYLVGLQTALCRIIKETQHAKKGERTFTAVLTARDAYRDTDHSQVQV